MGDWPLRGRYIITHFDGEPIDPARRHFVLSVDTDPAALAALAAYATAVAASHPRLAQSIRAEYGLTDSAPPGDERLVALLAWDEALAAIRGHDVVADGYTSETTYATWLAHGRRRGELHIAEREAYGKLWDALDRHRLASGGERPASPEEGGDVRTA